MVVPTKYLLMRVIRDQPHSPTVVGCQSCQRGPKLSPSASSSQRLHQPLCRRAGHNLLGQTRMQACIRTPYPPSTRTPSQALVRYLASHRPYESIVVGEAFSPYYLAQATFIMAPHRPYMSLNGRILGHMRSKPITSSVLDLRSTSPEPKSPCPDLDADPSKQPYSESSTDLHYLASHEPKWPHPESDADPFQVVALRIKRRPTHRPHKRTTQAQVTTF